MKAAGLFAGIGGIELGFDAAGVSTEFSARLSQQRRKCCEAFPSAHLSDVRALKSLPSLTFSPGVSRVKI